MSDATVQARASRAPGRYWLATVIVLALLAWVALAAWLIWSARADLVTAEGDLRAAREALDDGDLETAQLRLDDAVGASRAAASGLDNPVVLPLRLVPIVGQDLRAAVSVAHAGRDVSASARTLVESLTTLPDGFASLAPRDGRLPVDAIQLLSGPLDDLAATVAEAHDSVDSTPTSGRVSAVSDARARTLELLSPLVDGSATAAGLARVLPSFLGADGQRSYLFGASNPAELRGTGGFIGSVSVLTVDDGRLAFGPFTATSDLPVLAADALPPPVGEDARRWGRYGGTGAWHRLHRTADFPTAATAMEQLWLVTEARSELDGMLVADPFAFEALLEMSGPVEDPTFGVLDAETVVDYVANEAYTEFTDQDERKEVLGAVAATTFGAFLDGGAVDDPRAVVDRLGRLIAGGHLLLHARDEHTQAALARAGTTGALADPDGDLVNVVVNSGSASKVDYYVERRIQHTVTLLEDGATRNELTVSFTNDAPTSGPPAYVIGPNNPRLDAGEALFDVTVYAARGARFTRTPPATPDLPSFTETELGHPVHDGWVRLESGQSTDRQYTWVTADAWTHEDGEIRYTLRFQGQTVIRPTAVELLLSVPEGLRPVALPDGAELTADGDIRWVGEIRGENVQLPVRLERD